MSYAKRKHLAPGFNYFVGDHYRIRPFTYICAAQLSVKPNKGIAMANQLTFLCIYSGTTSLNGFIIRIFPLFSIHTLFQLERGLQKLDFSQRNSVTVSTNPLLFENGDFFLRFGLPFTLTRWTVTAGWKTYFFPKRSLEWSVWKRTNCTITEIFGYDDVIHHAAHAP